MIAGAVFCPHPPVLVPEVASGAAPELDELRAACERAIGRLSALDVDQVVVLGSAATSQRHSPVARGSLRGFGIEREVHLGSPGCGGNIELPLSLTIGAWLLSAHLGSRSGALGFSVAAEFAGTRLASDLLGLALATRIGLLVMGDGSARRSEKAPGHLDPRAGEFDAEVARILGTGDGAALAELPLGLGGQLLAAGVPAWRAAGALLAGDRWSAELDYADAPYGVGYFVASWLP